MSEPDHQTVNADDRGEALRLAGRIRWFVGYSDKMPIPLRNDLLGVAADLEIFAGPTGMLVKGVNQPTSTVDDPVARTKVDPNRSYREDALVAEIERLKAEKATATQRIKMVNEEWDVFVAAAIACDSVLDQWEKFKFRTKSGWIYVTISRSNPYSDEFEAVSFQVVA